MTGIFISIVGGGGPFSLFTDRTISDSQTVGNTAEASITLNTNGFIAPVSVVTPSGGLAWYNPVVTGIGSSHWCRWTLNSGALTTNPGGAGTWLPLSAAYIWARNRTGAAGTTSATITIDISTSSGGSPIVATAQFVLSAILT